jgi:two-component system, LuxR family, sensor kinase FixL
MDGHVQDTALLAAILNTAVDAIVTIDERGTVLHVNRAFGKLFGFTSEEIVGKNISMLMPEPDRSAHDGYLQKYMQTGKAAIIGVGRQVLGQRKDGSLIPVDLAVSEVKIGNQTLFAGIMRDMTERQRTEADLLTTQQKLIQSERLAAIGQMVTGLAHESRNALQRSRACLDMLSLDLESVPEQHDLVQRSKSALVELQTLYEEVRNYAAPIQLERSRCNLQRLCNEVWGNLVDQWRANHIQLEMNCAPCPDVRCDKHRIGQVFRNLFENSLSVAPANSRIRVDCRVIVGEDSEGQRVEVTVSDEGPGFELSQRSKIFEPFYTTKTKGTGLGMAICKRIIDAHDGKIFVVDRTMPLRQMEQPGSNSHQRKEQVGATIVFELPVE